MKGEVYTVAFMPSSGRRIKTFSLSIFKLGLISVLFFAFLVLLLTVGSLAAWRSYRKHERMASEAIENYEALNKELQAVRKSYSDFINILNIEKEEVAEGSGKGGPEMPALLDITGFETSRNTPTDADSALEEAASLRTDLRKLTKITIAKREEFARMPSIWPVKFGAGSQIWISSRYGRRRSPFTGAWEMHEGADIPAPQGTPIIAAADGVIVKIERDRFLGNFIEIRHGNKYSTLYGHMQCFAEGLEQGDEVERGDIIGLMGSTGRSTGTHVHYEVRVNGRHVDPESYILN